jgi:apolipoprotein N-acyltransferase
MSQATSFMWLTVGAVLFGVSTRTSAIPIAAWLALAFMLHAARALPPFPGLVYVALALYIALALGNRGYIPIEGPAYFFAIAGITVTMIAPFAADLFLASRITGWISTLIFPMAWVACEFARARLTPGASWGSIAYSQYGDLPLMQLVAFTGIWGISFLIAWFASIVNWAWAQNFDWTAIRALVLGYGILLCLILAAGGLRLALAPTNGRSIRAAVVSFPKDMFVPGEVTRIVQGRVNANQRGLTEEKLGRLHDWFLESSRREARSGAQLVAWPEQSLLVLKEDEPAFLEDAQRLAADERIYLVMGMAAVQVGAARPFENKVVLVNPSGKIVFSYLKSRPAPPEAAIMVRGDGHLPIVATDVGRIASAICFEADFPEFVRQIGRAPADLWVVPVNDWEAIKRMHFEMLVFRAIENGTPIVRATSSGVSGTFDAWGRMLGVTDHSSGSRILVSQVPLGGFRTLYSYIGDLFAWLCVASVVAAVVRVVASHAQRS